MRVIRDGEEILIDVSQLNVGDIFAVRQGEAFAADGVITEGECAVDESMLTGESIPVDKSVGDSVFSGTVPVPWEKCPGSGRCGKEYP